MADLTNWTVMVVEDDEDAQRVLGILLQNSGITVTTASTGEDALELLTSNPPNAVIIDLHLPQMDGWELLRNLKANPTTANIPAVAITAYDSVAAAQEALDSGFAAYFRKPIDARTFVDRLSKALG